MNQVKILGLSGKKQSGKNTAGNYIVGLFLKSLKITEDFEIDKKGRLIVTDIFGNQEYKDGVIDMNSRHPNFLLFAEENIFPFVKLYSYADVLKQKVCIDILGLTYEQCYGTNTQKDSLTNLKWEDMPGVFDGATFDGVQEVGGDWHGEYTDAATILGVVYHEPGFMTAREVMQFVGTEIFRKMYGDVWIDATIRQIKQDDPTMAIITDVRFPNEVDRIINASSYFDDLDDGKVLRFGRDIFEGEDQHESETALDKFPKTKYSYFLDNQDMSITEQNKKVKTYLKKQLWLPQEIPAELLEVLPTE